MSPARHVHRLAHALADQTSVAVEAEYERSERRWHLWWRDGPNRATMGQLVTTVAARLGLPSGSAETVQLRRQASDLGTVAAALSYLRDQPGESVAHRGDSLHERTDYPERADEALLGQARHALAQSQRPWAAVADALAYLDRVGPTGLAADLWRDNTPQPQGGGTDSLLAVQRKERRSASPPTVSRQQLPPATRERLRGQVAELVTRLATSTSTETGPLGKLWAIDQARHLLLAELDEHGRRTAAEARATGVGLGAMSRQLGHDRSTLRKRWPNLETDAAPLRWLYTHAETWQAALATLVDTLKTGGYPLERADRDRLNSLRQQATSPRWQDLRHSPETVRTLLTTLDRKHLTSESANIVDELAALLADYDTAAGEHG